MKIIMEQVISPVVTVDVQLHLISTVCSSTSVARSGDKNYPYYCSAARSTQTSGNSLLSLASILTISCSDSALFYCYFEDNSSAK